ncbi:2-haloacid dehalogenase [Novosphingobium sp. SG751A]|uniref:HAD family hydrolase n=1 Tax=Novosphingobium sp. SG751A TaxID=2587000 RepID=UPI001557D4A6|nr:HAD family phosphatase [Novosphingobium sp. SG751A]NOW47277.1 2-haloacid dehalogenase [Novosphingobium sp. SG751A]
MSEKQPHVVVFDIGRVLVKWRIAGLYEKLIPDADRLEWFLREVVSEEWHAQHDAGKPFAEMIEELAQEHPEERALIELYAPRWLECVPGPIEGTHDIVRALDARGVPLYSITNFGVDAWAMFRPTFPVLDHFRDIVVSGHERMIKPDAAIFDLAAQRFGHAPGEMFFIDDNADNIAAARTLGWHVHHFVDGAEALEADLRGRGLL